jgi:methyl-accepting chemotaxis protein
VVQIGGAMGQLTKATAQNASASEELAATSEELSGQAKQLQDSIGFFNVGDAPTRVAARLESAAPRRARTPQIASSLMPAAVRSNATGNNFRPY